MQQAQLCSTFQLSKLLLALQDPSFCCFLKKRIFFYFFFADDTTNSFEHFVLILAFSILRLVFSFFSCDFLGDKDSLLFKINFNYYRVCVCVCVHPCMQVWACVCHSVHVDLSEQL